MAGAIEGEGEIVVKAVGVGVNFDGLTEIRNAALRVAFAEQRGALLEIAFGLSGSGELLDGDGGTVARTRGRGRLRETYATGEQESEEQQRETANGVHGTPEERKELSLAPL